MPVASLLKKRLAAATFVSLAAGGAVAACGGMSKGAPTDTSPPLDADVDATGSTSVQMDDAAPVIDDDAEMAMDASDDGHAIVDAAPDCSTVHMQLNELLDASTCGACVKAQCASFLATCTQSCQCTTGMEFLFTCLSLGNNAGQCQTETLPYTTPDEFGPIVACKEACLYSCSPLEAGPPDDAP